jgi:hypothetical protein
MIFYTIEFAANTSETGSTYPQIQKMSPGYDYNSPNSVYALDRKTTEFPDFIPNLDYFVLHNRAKLSDMLSASVLNTCGFIVSEKFKKLIEGFNIIPHQFYDANVYYKKEKHPYYWMHIIGSIISYVDYKKSVFFAYHNYSHNLGYISIDSFEDFVLKKEKIKRDNPTKTVTIWAEKIYLNKNFDSALDFFQIGTFNSQYFISDRLKLKLQENNITGILIKENTVIDF